MNELCKFGHTF